MILVIKHRPPVEPRLEASLIDGLRTDLDGLNGKRLGATAAQSASQASTATQNTKLADTIVRLNPTEARGLGILDADINALEALLLLQ